MLRMLALSALILAAAGSAIAEENATTDDADTRNILLHAVEPVLTGVNDYTLNTEKPSALSPLTLDVKQCVDLALKQNAQILVAEEDVNAKKEAVGQAKSQRLPKLSVEAGYGYTQKMGDVNSPLIALMGILPSKEVFTTGLNIEQVLYAGGQIQAAVRASQYLAKSETWKQQAKRDEIVFETRQAFYDTLLAKALIEVAQDSVRTFERHHADAKQMLDVGLVSHFEVLRAETELGARQTDLESSRTAAEIALVNLRRIMGLPQDQPLTLTGELAWNPETNPVETLIQTAKDHRPELLALDQGIAAAEQNVALKRGQFKPKAAASAEWQNSDGSGEMMPDGWKVTIGAQWDIYAGGRRKHEVHEAEAQLRSLKYQHTDVERLIELDVRQAYLRLQEAIAKIKKEKSTVELGREGLRLAQLRFQEGAGTQAETLDAELAFTQSRTTLARALHDYALALAALDKAVARNSQTSEEKK